MPKTIAKNALIAAWVAAVEVGAAPLQDVVPQTTVFAPCRPTG